MNLTSQTIKHYSFAQVIQTPKPKRCIASDNVVFFRPLFSMVGRARNKIPSGNYSADFGRFEAPDRPHFADGQLPSKEPKIMSTQSNIPPERDKSDSSSPNIIQTSARFIDPERRKAIELQKWHKELQDFIKPLSDSEIILLNNFTRLVFKKPRKKHQKCKQSQIIKFPKLTDTGE